MIPVRPMMRGHVSSRQLRLSGRLLAAVLCAAVSAPVLASTEYPRLSEYVLTEWTKQTGLPSGQVRAITQDTDGYLWFATDKGLVRFDGTAFRVMDAEPLGDRPPFSLASARDGSVWVGYNDPGGVARVRGRDIVTFSVKDGLFEGRVRMLLEDDDGTMWAGGRGGLARYRAGKWQIVGEEHGLPNGRVYSLFLDARKNIWLSSSAGIFRRAANQDHFITISRDITLVATLATDRQGNIWAADNHSLTKIHDGTALVPAGSPGSELPVEANLVSRDADGNLWVGVSGEGLLRFNPAAAGPKVTKALATTVAHAVFEDRDQNIWAGTPDALVRLRRAEVKVEQPLSSRVVLAVVGTKDSFTWVGTFNGLNKFLVRDGAARPAGTWLLGHQVIALHIDRLDRLWVATDRGDLGTLVGDHFRPAELPREIRPRRIRALAVDWEERLWICDSDVGLYVWDGRTKITFDNNPAIAHKQCFSAHTDRAGRVWIGFIDGLARFSNDETRFFGSSDGLVPGFINSIYEDSSHAMWIGAGSGLSRIAGESVVTLGKATGVLSDVTAITQDTSGYIWLAASVGLLQIDPAAFSRAAADPRQPFDYAALDSSDGVDSTVGPFGQPRAATAADGSLWFATSQGIALLDPRRVLRHSPHRQVTINNLVVDGQSVEGPAPATLPAGTRRVQIDFSALNLSTPNKVRYRYMMRGFDGGWVQNVFAHQASYTNLPPGNYEFLVSATTGDIWNESRAVWAFRLMPRFYQTKWFVPALVLACAIAVVSVWRFHLSSVRRKLALISAERARLSREIHDTLLQTLVGVALELEVIDTQQRAASGTDSGRAASGSTDVGRAASAPPNSGIRLLRQRVQAQIREAREWVAKLRTPSSEFDDISHELRRFANRATEGTAVRFHLTSTGQADWCSRRTKEQLLRIAQEAITNAVRHGRPSVIRCELHFAADGVRLRVSDDGRGFNIDESHIGKGDHWGLVSMKERAELVGGRFTVASYAGGGTSIEVVAPRLSELASINN
jgi:ligand-binding sensor domain-containing protein/two-component sensor histidine kinase